MRHVFHKESAAVLNCICRGKVGVPETSLTLLHHLRQSNAGQAWVRLVTLYEPVIRAWPAHSRLQQADIDDLCQEVLQRLSQSLVSFEHRGLPGSFRRWLRTITLNTLRDFWRRKQRGIGSEQNFEPSSLEVLEDENDELTRRWDEECNKVLVESALQLVRPHFDAATWDAFCRVTFENQSPQEVAAALSISVNSVYLARSRVLRRLRNEIRGLLD
jgi:RNA polymerase sigma-70 factor (ECF subfamily)